MVLLVPVLAALAPWAFARPAARTAPHDLPLGVDGSGDRGSQVHQRRETRDGDFGIPTDETGARDATEEGTVYGAVAATDQGARLLTAFGREPAPHSPARLPRPVR